MHMVCNISKYFVVYSAATLFWLLILCANLSNLWQKGGVNNVGYVMFSLLFGTDMLEVSWMEYVAVWL